MGPKQKGMTKGNQKKKKTARPGSAVAPTGRELPGRILLWASGALIALSAISRVVLSHYPMTRDEGTYGYLGKLAMKGFTPYVDFYEMKPPMLYYLYGLGGTLFGFSDVGLRLWGMVMNLLAGIMIYLILRRYTASAYAWIAAALFSLLSLNLFAYGYTMVAEHIINALLLVSIYLVHLRDQPRGPWFLVLGGVSFALAVLTKQTAILLAPVYLLLFLFTPSRQSWWKDCLYMSAGALLPVLLAGGLLWMKGALPDAQYWLIEYPSKYGSHLTPKDGMHFLSFFFRHIMTFQLIVIAVSAPVLLLSLVSGWRKKTGWLYLYFFLSILLLVPGFRFYGQYWLLLFPPFAMLTGWGLERLDMVRKSYGSIAGILVLLALVVELGVHSGYYFSEKRFAEADKLNYNNPFDAIRKLSQYAGNLMQPGDSIMMFGSEPQVYLYAHRVAPTRHVFMGMLTDPHARKDAYVEEVLQDLKERKPAYVLFNVFPFSWTITPDSDKRLYNDSFLYVDRHYTAVAAYDMTQQQYHYASDGTPIDTRQANQVILYKINP